MATVKPNDEQLGRLVRDVWMEWAREQPDIEQRPDWIDPWEKLPARIQEVDSRIGCVLFAAGFTAAVTGERYLTMQRIVKAATDLADAGDSKEYQQAALALARELGALDRLNQTERASS